MTFCELWQYCHTHTHTHTFCPEDKIDETTALLLTFQLFFLFFFKECTTPST